MELIEPPLRLYDTYQNAFQVITHTQTLPTHTETHNRRLPTNIVSNHYPRSSQSLILLSCSTNTKASIKHLSTTSHFPIKTLQFLQRVIDSCFREISVRGGLIPPNANDELLMAFVAWEQVQYTQHCLLFAAYGLIVFIGYIYGHGRIIIVLIDI